MPVRGKGSFMRKGEEEEALRIKVLVWEVGSMVSEGFTAQLICQRDEW